MKHDWRFVGKLHNGTHLWKCDRCGGESWTNVLDNDPPGPGALGNSGTPENCDEAFVLNIMEEKSFGHR